MQEIFDKKFIIRQNEQIEIKTKNNIILLNLIISLKIVKDFYAYYFNKSQSQLK